jgi:hypothetical protein
MAEQSPEYWERKELKKQASIVAQSCLERAVDTVLGLGASGLDKFTLENVIKRVSETYNSYCSLVWNKTDELLKENNSEVKSFPTPTLEQKKALELVKKETKWTAEQVYRKFGKFPIESNVNACIKKIKESN